MESTKDDQTAKEHDATKDTKPYTKTNTLSTKQITKDTTTNCMESTKDDQTAKEHDATKDSKANEYAKTNQANHQRHHDQLYGVHQRRPNRQRARCHQRLQSQRIRQNQPSKSPKTPRPTVWSPPKTTKPPKSTMPPKTPKPTNTPKPTKTPRPTVTYLQPTPRPTVGGGWGVATPEPTMQPTERPTEDGWGMAVPLKGCAKNMGKKDCGMNDKCTWKSGYPPLAFSEDSDYQLLSADESFFANMDGSVVNMINDMFVVVSLLALRQCMMQKKKKVVVDSNVNMDYGSLKVEA